MSSGSPVEGKAVVLTGKFSELKRAEAQKQLKALGAIIKKSVSKNVDILIAGEKAGSKLDKAEKLGVEIRREPWLLAVLDGRDPDAEGPLLGEEVAALDAAGLEALLEQTDWEKLDPARDLAPLVRALHDLEREQGVTELHRAFSAAVVPAARPKVSHVHVHRNRPSSVALSPCGRYLATGSEAPSGRYDDGGEIAIWELASGRVLEAIYGVEFGVGWGDVEGCITWSQDGETIAASFATNVVGTFGPFDGRGGPLMSACITSGWDSPPSFVLSPDASKLCISCWGGGSELPGGVVSTAQNEQYWDSDYRISWFSDAGIPADTSFQNWRALGWEGGQIYGMNEGHGQAWAVDEDTLRMTWSCQVHGPAAFSPDGALLAHNPAGLVLYDGRTGQPTTQLPMIVGGTEVIWSPVASQRRLALLVGPNNKFEADPGVHVFDDGELVATVHDPPLRDSSYWNFPDAKQLAFSMDGERVALLTAPGEVAIWSLADGGGKESVLTVTERASGLFWGDGALVVMGQNILEFWDVERGVRFARHDLLPPPGMLDPLPGPGAWQDQLPGERSYFPLPDLEARRWRWVIARPEGMVACEPGDAAALDDHLVLSMGGGRIGWPWRWAEGAGVLEVYTEDDAIPHDKIRALWRRAHKDATAPSSGGFSRYVLAEHRDEFALRDSFEEAQVDVVQMPARPLHEYHAPAPLYGDAITPEALRQLVGETVLYCEDWRPRYVSIVTILAMTDYGLSYYYVSPSGGAGSGSISADSLFWIGEAEWLGE